MLSAQGSVLNATLYSGAPPNPTGVMADMFNGGAPLVALTAKDTNVGTGGAGMSVDGKATIDSFIVRGSCDFSGALCTGMYDGSFCHYGCSSGFYPVGIASVCGRSGYYSTAKCRAYSPYMPQNQAFSVFERSPGATQIVPAVQATVALQAIAVSFAVADQGPYPYTDTFGISLCGGNLIVNNPANLDLTLDPSPSVLWVNISAMSDNDAATSVFGVFNVTIIPVPLPPVFDPLPEFTVNEGTPGPIYPALVAQDPQRLPLQYAVTFSTVAGAILIDAVTGVLSIAPPGLDYISLIAEVRGIPNSKLLMTSMFNCSFFAIFASSHLTGLHRLPPSCLRRKLVEQTFLLLAQSRSRSMLYQSPPSFRPYCCYR